MAGNIDDVVDAAQDAVIAVGGKNGAISGVVGPIAPVFALRILAVFFVVLIDEALRAAPNGLHDPRPGIANADISGFARARLDLFSVLVPDDRINAENCGACAAGLHGIESGFRAAEEAPGFGLPPGVDDYGFPFANCFVIPTPNFRLDRFADSGHVLEMIVVLFRLVAAGFAEHADGGGRSMENVDVETLGDAPGTRGIRELRDAFVKDAGGAECERAVHDVGVAGDPADVGHAPVNVPGMNVLVIL